MGEILYSVLSRSKTLSDTFPLQNGQKKRDTLSPLLFNIALECSMRKAPKNQEGLE
jgi:hypothetical protein